MEHQGLTGGPVVHCEEVTYIAGQAKEVFLPIASEDWMYLFMIYAGQGATLIVIPQLLLTLVFWDSPLLGPGTYQLG